MSDNWANLDGGRFLAELFQKDSVQGAFLQKIINAINKLGATLGANPVGDVQPPPPIDNLNISTSNELMQLSLNHNHAVTKAISYFAEVDTNPNFTNPIVKHFGPSRSPGPFPLPSLDANGNRIPYYVRAFCQYPGSKPSRPTVFGGPLNPAPITMGGSTSMTLLASTGSGTSSPTGQQGGQGFGKAPAQPKVQGPIQVSIGSVVPVTPIVTPIIPSPVLSDGLIHGDSIWDIDDAVFWLRDDFSAFSLLGSGGAITSQLYWAAKIASGDGNDQQGGAPPHLGGLVFPNSGTTAQVSFLVQGAQTAWSGSPLTYLWPLIEYPSWKMVWEFEVCRSYQVTNISTVNAFNWAQVSCYVGLGSFPALGTAGVGACPRLPYFLGLRYDTDPTAPAISDTDFVFEAVANSTSLTTRAGLNPQGTVVHTGITPTEGKNYRLELQCTVTGKVLLTLSDGTTTFSSTLTMPKFNAGTGSQARISNGIGVFYPGVIPPSGPGTRMTISGCTGSFTPFNGTQVAVGGGSTSWINYLMSGTLASGNVTGTPVCSCYPAMLPYLAFGNDTSASPVANSKAVTIDFFAFVWNPGVGGGSGTPNPVLPRYF